MGFFYVGFFYHASTYMNFVFKMLYPVKPETLMLFMSLIKLNFSVIKGDRNIISIIVLNLFLLCNEVIVKRMGTSHVNY